MYCTNCGSKMEEQHTFCTTCGARRAAFSETVTYGQTAESKVENSTLNEADTSAADTLSAPQTMPKKRLTKKQVCSILLVSLILVVAVILILKPRNSLKYDWGTTRDFIMQREPDGYMDWDDYCFPDPDHKIDSIIEFDRIDGWDVICEFDHDTKELYSIKYGLGDDISYNQKVAILCKYYGNNYYSNDARTDKYKVTVWNSKDTVVVLECSRIIYYEASYYWWWVEWLTSDYRELREFFDMPKNN